MSASCTCLSELAGACATPTRTWSVGPVRAMPLRAGGSAIRRAAFAQPQRRLRPVGARRIGGQARARASRCGPSRTGLDSTRLDSTGRSEARASNARGSVREDSDAVGSFATGKCEMK